MALEHDPIKEDEMNCITADLVGGFPPTVDFLGEKVYDGTWAYVYSAKDTTGVLVSVFKMVFGSWKKRS